MKLENIDFDHLKKTIILPNKSIKFSHVKVISYKFNTKNFNMCFIV